MMNTISKRRLRIIFIDSCNLEDDTPTHATKRARVTKDRNNKPCYFDKLPREIRDMVYGYLWKATSLINKNFTRRIECALQRRPLSVLHKRSIRGQTSSHYAVACRNGCSLIRRSSPKAWTSCATGIWELDFDAPDMSEDTFSPGLLHPSSATMVRAHFPICAAERYDKMDKELHIIINLKELDITMSVWSLQDMNPYHGINFKQPIKWDMHSLATLRERFPGLRSLTIYLTCVSPLRYPFVPQAYTKELCAAAVKAIKDAVGPTFGKDVKIESEIYLSNMSNEQMMLTFERK
jgi:hypothetical protein